MRDAGVAHAEVRVDQGSGGAGDHRMTLRDQVIAALKKVYDPEMPVNIYELGLIYNVDVDPQGQVALRMTLTAPNCPVAGTLPADAERAVRAVHGVTGGKLELVFDPC